MENFSNYILKDKFRRVPLKISRTKHLIIKAKVNGIEGRFILDTGASNSCIGFEFENHFNIISVDSTNTAAGAGATGMKTKVSYSNNLQLSRWKNNDFTFIIFDLSHVNQALVNYKEKPVNGILGADLLIENHAIIDYAHKNLYIK